VHVEHDINLTDARFSVQYVIRPQTEELHDYRGYAGKINSGIYAKGDEVTVLPAGLTSRIKSVEIGGKEIDEAFAPQSVVLQLEDDIDISRGDVIVKSDNLSPVGQELDVLLCWMDNKPLIPGNKYFFQINSRVVRSVVKEIEYRLDVNTLQKDYNPSKAGLNDIIKARIRTASPIPYDSYIRLQVNGSAILIDETSHVTVGACMIQ
jgi:sulfate adenylyltransferase subunit 1